MFNLNKIIDPYKVVMIDIDNTIIDYNSSHDIALSKTLEKYNFSIDEYNKAKKIVKSRNLRSSQHSKKLYFKQILDIKNLPYYLVQEIVDYYNNEFINSIKVSSDIYNLLIYAKSKNKIIIAISDFYLNEQIEKINKANLLSVIDYLVTSEEFEEEKPGKNLIDYALQLSKTKPEDCIMIGDSQHDNFIKYNIFSYPYSTQKLLISISGKSGSGKTFISNKLSKLGNENNTLIIEGDGYHKYERSNEIWNRLTHYNIECNNLVQMGIDIMNIFYKSTNALIPVYDHSSGTFSKPLKIDSEKNIIIINGLHCLYPEVTGNFIPIRIFIDSELSDEQKIIRDTTNRNTDKDKVINSIKKRDGDYHKYIDIQKQYANILIYVFKDYSYKIEFSNDFDLEQKVYAGKYNNLADDLYELINKMYQHRFKEGN